MKDEIKKLLLSLGIRSTYNGFQYLCYALELCLEREDYLLAVYSNLYVDVAENFHTSRNNIEHCIRTVVSYCWERGNRERLMQLAGYELKDKPTNGEFIDILYQHLVLLKKDTR